jgi:hypothetical protein
VLAGGAEVEVDAASGVGDGAALEDEEGLELEVEEEVPAEVPAAELEFEVVSLVDGFKSCGGASIGAGALAVDEE